MSLINESFHPYEKQVQGLARLGDDICRQQLYSVHLSAPLSDHVLHETRREILRETVETYGSNLVFERLNRPIEDPTYIASDDYERALSEVCDEVEEAMADPDNFRLKGRFRVVVEIEGDYAALTVKTPLSDPRL